MFAPIVGVSIKYFSLFVILKILPIIMKQPYHHQFSKILNQFLAILNNFFSIFHDIEQLFSTASRAGIMTVHIVGAKYKIIDGGWEEEKIAITRIYKTNLQQPLLRFLDETEMCIFLASFCWRGTY